MAGLIASARAEPELLHMANRPEFIAADTVQKFEAETGIQVTYDVYPTGDAAAASLAHGNKPGWDLVVVSAVPDLLRGVEHHWFQPVPPSSLANSTNLDPRILTLTALVDPGNQMGVPYLWGMAGLVVNADRLKSVLPDAPEDSLALVFDPDLAARLGACGVIMEDSPDDAIPAALAQLGLDPQSQAPHDLEQAGDLLLKLKPLVRRLPSDGFIEALASGSACVGFGASIDVADARTRADQRGTGVELRFIVPRERSRMWIDVLAIPVGAQHPDAARAFIDFILRPEIISDITDWTGAVNPNILAADFVDDDKTDQTVFPSEQSRARLFLDRPITPEAAAVRARIWAKSKP
jgi:putrescine transport system substrate-binding protein